MSKVTRIAVVHHSAITHFPQAIERIREKGFDQIFIPETSITALTKGLVSQTVTGMRITEALRDIQRSEDVFITRLNSTNGKEDLIKDVDTLINIAVNESKSGYLEQLNVEVEIFVQDSVLYTLLFKAITDVKVLSNTPKISMLSSTTKSNFFTGTVKLSEHAGEELCNVFYGAQGQVPLEGLPKSVRHEIYRELHLCQGGQVPSHFAIEVNHGVIFVCDNGILYDHHDYRRIADSSHRVAIKEKNALQRVAMGYLLNDSIPVVSLGGPAGTGKTGLSLAAGAHLVGKNSDYENLLVFRPVRAVGGEEIGFLPGTEAEKMEPWSQGVYDAVRGFCNASQAKSIIEKIQVLPLTNIRGRTFHNSFVIVDEAQSLDMTVLKTVITRLGDNSKLVLTHDIRQNDNRFMKEGEGMPVIVERLKASSFFAHLDLVTSERSEVAKEVNHLLEDF